MKAPARAAPRPVTLDMSDELEITDMADIAAQDVRWLWPGRIALGRVTLLAGDPGLGKSLVSLGIAAAVSRGLAWPVGGGFAPVGDVLLLSAEDDPGDTLRPRLDAAGADVTRVKLAGSVFHRAESGKFVSVPFNLADGIEALQKRLCKIPKCRLLVIDPLSAYYGTTDSYKNAEVRGMLAPLGDLARAADIAILAVEHLNKSNGRAALHRVQGSIGLVGAVRAAHLVARDQASPQRRLLLPLKNNIGPDSTGLAYSITTAENGAPVICWEPSPVSTTADTALADEQDDRQTVLGDAADWLAEQLAGGPLAVKVLKQEAKDAGFVWRTVQRARTKAGIRAYKMRFNEGWEWALPSVENPEGRQGDTLPPESCHPCHPPARAGVEYKNLSLRGAEKPKDAKDDKDDKDDKNIEGDTSVGVLGALRDGDDIEEEVL